MFFLISDANRSFIVYMVVYLTTCRHIDYRDANTNEGFSTTTELLTTIANDGGSVLTSDILQVYLLAFISAFPWLKCNAVHYSGLGMPFSGPSRRLKKRLRYRVRAW